MRLIDFSTRRPVTILVLFIAAVVFGAAVLAVGVSTRQPLIALLSPIGWLGGSLNYPLQQGAAAAIYYGERLYQ